MREEATPAASSAAAGRGATVAASAPAPATRLRQAGRQTGGRQARHSCGAILCSGAASQSQAAAAWAARRARARRLQGALQGRRRGRRRRRRRGPASQPRAALTLPADPGGRRAHRAAAAARAGPECVKLWVEGPWEPAPGPPSRPAARSPAAGRAPQASGGAPGGALRGTERDRGGRQKCAACSLSRAPPTLPMRTSEGPGRSQAPRSAGGQHRARCLVPSEPGARQTSGR